MEVIDACSLLQFLQCQKVLFTSSHTLCLWLCLSLLLNKTRTDLSFGPHFLISCLIFVAKRFARMGEIILTTALVPLISIQLWTTQSDLSHDCVRLAVGLVEPTDAGPTRSTVFINDVAFEVGLGPFNVREVFGDDAVLIHSSGEPLITNEWGLTLQPLQHGAFYYLLRTSTPSNTIDLVPNSKIFLNIWALLFLE